MLRELFSRRKIETTSKEKTKTPAGLVIESVASTQEVMEVAQPIIDGENPDRAMLARFVLMGMEKEEISPDSALALLDEKQEETSS